jgi:hypothetical protein
MLPKSFIIMSGSTRPTTDSSHLLTLVQGCKHALPDIQVNIGQNQVISGIGLESTQAMLS